ncbi:polyphenol oxidase family protein [Castellaniella defragrans]|uniref:polyphenol oxidase family protein n=1 Tax=Castellaniella defragrans TaxID=75697 RepID=UPI002AFEC30C|nr:polyphenol oxidase family protein [Castellaniella defragrans]
MATRVLEPAPGLRGVTGEPWPGVRYFSTWRVGGVSLPPRDSLNLGLHVGDDPLAVRENRLRLRRALPGDPLWLEQVHGTDVFDADAAPEDAAAGPAPRADAAVTTRRGRPLAIMTADCLPVVLADEAGTVLGVAHAGWRGLAAGVLENTLAAMRRRAPAARGWRAWIGPGIGPAAFQVGAEVREAFLDQDPGLAACFVFQPDRGLFAAGPPQGRKRPSGGMGLDAGQSLRTGLRLVNPSGMQVARWMQAAEGCAAWGPRWLADLAGLARARLLRAGVERVEASGECTWTRADRYFSHRRDPGSGRQAALACLTDPGALQGARWT